MPIRLLKYLTFTTVDVVYVKVQARENFAFRHFITQVEIFLEGQKLS